MKTFGFDERRVATASIILSVGILLTKALGFASMVFVASIFGATSVVDSFYVAILIPMIVMSVVLAVFDPLIPVFVEHQSLYGDSSTWHLASTVGICLLVIIGMVVVTLIIFMAPIVRLMAPGFSSDTITLTVTLARIAVLGLLFTVLAGYTKALLQTRMHFVVPSLNPIILPTLTIVLIVLWHNPVALVLPYLIAPLLQVMTHLWVLRRFGASLSLRIHAKPLEIFHVLRHTTPPLVITLASQSVAVLERMLGSLYAAGTIATMGYAYRFVDPFLGLIMFTLPTALFPVLARDFASGHAESFERKIKQGLVILLVISAPVAVLLFFLSEPLINLLLGHGAFTEQAVYETALTLRWYAPVLIVSPIIYMLYKVFYSMREGRFLIAIALFSVLVNVIMDIILIRAMGAPGAAAALLIASTIQSVLLFGWVSQRFPNLLAKMFARSILKVSFSVLALSLICLACGFYFAQNSSSSVGWLLLQVAMTASIGLVVYVVLLVLLQVDEIALTQNSLHPLLLGIVTRVRQVISHA